MITCTYSYNSYILYRSVQHPNILCLMGVLTTDCEVMLITNLVSGKDLHSRIFDPDAIPVGCSLSSASCMLCIHVIHLHDCIPQMEEITKLLISVQLAQALAFLHTGAPQTVHLDVKPANVLVRPILF